MQLLPTGPSGRLAALVAVLVLAGLSVLASPAAAHTRLERAEPADGARLGAAPPAVRLVFDEAVQESLATVVVTGPGGAAAEGAPRVVDATVEQAVRDVGAGDYAVAFRVVSADGHPITGELTFTVAPRAPATAAPPSPAASSPAVASPAPTASPAATAAAAADADQGGTGHARHLVPLAAVAAAAVVVVGVTTWRQPAGSGRRGSGRRRSGQARSGPAP